MDMGLRSDFLTFIAAFLAIPLLAMVSAVQVPYVIRRRQERRLVASVERALGHRPDRTHWGRIAVATFVGWCLAEMALVGVAPTLAVWVGGAVVTVGAVALVKVWGDPYRLDDHEFDRRLREMLDQG
jgi:uncharacterized membrane protein